MRDQWARLGKFLLNKMMQVRLSVEAMGRVAETASDEARAYVVEVSDEATRLEDIVEKTDVKMESPEKSGTTGVNRWAESLREC